LITSSTGEEGPVDFGSLINNLAAQLKEYPPQYILAKKHRHPSTKQPEIAGQVSESPSSVDERDALRKMMLLRWCVGAAISGEPGPEAGEPLCGGEEDATSMAISGSPDPEVGEPPLAVARKTFVSVAISGEPGSEAECPSVAARTTFVSMAISGEPGPEVSEPTGCGEKDFASVAISGEPGPEVGEPPPTWPPLFVSSFGARSRLFHIA
jgi:hypothetical protein